MLIVIILSLATLSFIVYEVRNGLGFMDVKAAGSGTTLYVGGFGSGNYSSIQAAIDAANNGDTVYVYSGTYNENVVVSTSITLMGQDRNTTIIDVKGYHKVVDVTADYVTFTGFTVKNSGNAGITPNGVQHCRIENTTVSNCYQGISLYSSSDCTIIHTTISNNKLYGIELFYSSNCTITHTTIYNDRFGIRLESYSNCTIHYNNIYGNAVYGVYNTKSAPEYTADASYNWWGSSDGPGGVGLGSGDNVSSNVIYRSWRTSPVSKVNNDKEDADGTPGFEFTLLIGAAGIALLMLRRKRRC